MSKHVAGLIGILIGIVAVIIMGFVWNAMLESIPHTDPNKPKPPTEVSVGVIAEPAPKASPSP
ncbi:MAG TPA: hypothetical protein VMS78_06185 [Rhizomicrobium sp.]|nr:hypothetical protein [Rhizomicrobium sp.]